MTHWGAPESSVPERTDRCAWCKADPLYVAYHDQEWGVPVHDEQRLFEFLVLETMQAGLSWHTVLKKREAFRAAFAGFDPVAVAAFGEAEVARCMDDPGIIRNRAKIVAAVKNARAFLQVQDAEGGFSPFMWSFADGRPQINHWRTHQEVPTTTPLSDAFSKALKERGFAFVGSIVCYSHLQATGVIMDHLVTCFRHRELLNA
ncbi:MAG: DNA-3-methyladenine glycosylase I [Firmicutes bacterium]|nr:DNA-3-methyladenine glycosylase I [Bacillota bacterium]